MRGIIRVDNVFTDEVYVSSTNDIEKYPANIAKYKDSGKTPPHEWVRNNGVGALRITLLEEMTEFDFNNTSFVKSKKKQWTYHLMEQDPNIKMLHKYDEEKKKQGKTKIQYNGAYEDIMMKLGEIEDVVVRIEEKVDAESRK